MPQEGTPKFFRPFWRRGAGVLAAIAVIVLFILAATFLKSLVAGLLLAYLFLPLEKFFERLFRGKPPKEGKKTLCVNLGLGAVLVSLFAGIALLLLVLTTILLPAAQNTGTTLQKFAEKAKTLTILEEELTPYLPEKVPGEGKAPVPPHTNPPGKELSQLIRGKLLPKLRNYMKENFQDFSSKSFQVGKIAFAVLSRLVSSVGTFLLDLLLAVFFFLYFLQKMALFTDAFLPEARGSEKNSSPGQWAVKGIFSSNFMPDVSEKTQLEAARLIDRICLMFQKWLRGYFTIIVLESILYITFFYLFSVPYALLLGVIAGLTILLPFLGPLASMVLTVSVCLAFTQGNTAFTLIGALLTYGLINGLLEQFYLYPRLVGKAIGLTTLETIIVVLLGGILAGISGMILAVPAAAILKLLIPELYRLTREEEEK